MEKGVIRVVLKGSAFHSHRQLLCFHPLQESKFVIINLLMVCDSQSILNPSLVVEDVG